MLFKQLKRYALAVFVALPTVASANVVWPSLYIVTGIMSWYIILAGLIANASSVILAILVLGFAMRGIMGI